MLQLCAMLTLLLHTALAAGSPCEKTRAAFDIGSGATKLRVARVDTCLQKEIEVLSPESTRTIRKVGYKDDLQHSRAMPPIFSDAVISSGIQALRELRS